MRNTAGASRRYSANLVPNDLPALVVFMQNELKNIEESLNNLADGYLEPITVAPAKPRNGMFRNASAGVLGASSGFYGYHDGAWSYLG